MLKKIIEHFFNQLSTFLHVRTIIKFYFQNIKRSRKKIKYTYVAKDFET